MKHKSVTKKQLEDYERLCRDRSSGRPLTPDGLRFICEAYHRKEMGKVLAEIHSIDKKGKKEAFFEMSIDWDFYLAEMKKRHKGDTS